MKTPNGHCSVVLAELSSKSGGWKPVLPLILALAFLFPVVPAVEASGPSHTAKAAKPKACAKRQRKLRHCRPAHRTNSAPAHAAAPGAGPDLAAPQVAPQDGYGAAANTYPWGECTWYAKERRPDIGNYWGNASNWLNSARSAGFPVGNVPVPGAIAVWGANMGGAGWAGHVAYVVSAAPGNNRITVADSNWVGHHVVSSGRVQSVVGIIGYIYGGPAGSGPSSGPPPPPPFAASLDAQALPGPIQAGGPGQALAFNVRFNQPFDVGNFVLRPDPVTKPDINHFLRLAGGLPSDGDWPAAVAPNDDHVGYFRGGIQAAPGTTQGHYFLRWNVVRRDTGQVGGLQPSTWVTVGNPPYGVPANHAVGFDAAFVTEHFPRRLAPGEEGSVTIVLRNTGTRFWGHDVRLGTLDDSPIRFASAGVLNANRVPWTSDQDGDGAVSPGETATFTYSLKSPPGQAAAFRQRFSLVEDAADGGRFAQSLGIYIPTVVADAQNFPSLSVAVCTWAFVTEAGSHVENGRLVVSNGSPGTFSVTIRNTSELCPWFPDGVAPFRLATDRLRDRASGFADLGAGWLSANRIRLPSPVDPGETVTIEFGVRPAPSVPVGLYNEYVNPVIDGRFHLDNSIAMHVPIDRR